MTVRGSGAAYMPRRDRTFTDVDIIRLINNHLDGDEQRRVLAFIQGGVSLEEFLIPIFIPVVAVLRRLEELKPTIDAAFDIARAFVDGRFDFALVQSNLQFWEKVREDVDFSAARLDSIDFTIDF